MPRRTTFAVVPLAATCLVIALPLEVTADDAMGTTQTSCSDQHECKTVSVDAAGALTVGSTSGTISLSGLGDVTAYSLVDVIETLGNGHMFVGGAYAMDWGTCAHGSATAGDYSASGGTSTFPHSPPSTTGTRPALTTDAAGGFRCSYSLTYPAVDSSDDSTCGHHLCAVRNDIFVVLGGATVTRLASASVEAPNAPPPALPEMPSPPLGAVAGLLVVGGAVLAGQRRLGVTAGRANGR